MTTSSSFASAPAGRIRATPYARRLARERDLPLAAITGSGPNGRITAIDLDAYRPVASAQPDLPAAAIAAPQPVAAVQAVAALAARVDFTAANALLAEITALHSGIGREDICLKASALALKQQDGMRTGDILLLTAPDSRRLLNDLAGASIGRIAALRTEAGDGAGAELAASFLERPGIRPVAAKLINDIPLRLVVGAGEKDHCAECLLSYDPAKIGDDAAENLLAAFLDLVEAPFRLLV